MNHTAGSGTIFIGAGSAGHIRQTVPRQVKAKITRTVTEIAIVTLDRDGTVEEIEDVHEELEGRQRRDLVHHQRAHRTRQVTGFLLSI